MTKLCTYNLHSIRYLALYFRIITSNRKRKNNPAFFIHLIATSNFRSSSVRRHTFAHQPSGTCPVYGTCSVIMVPSFRKLTVPKQTLGMPRQCVMPVQSQTISCSSALTRIIAQRCGIEFHCNIVGELQYLIV